MRDGQSIDGLRQFRASLRGDLILKGEPAYDQARKLYNAMIDKQPMMIARCVDAADVMSAVNFARQNGLLLAIRGGGHSAPGFSSVDGGMVIDLSAMKGIRVDPENRTVRVGAGCLTGEVDHATHAFGLAIPFGVISSTGVAGLTLSGGHGYLSRQYGLAADNLIEADVVLADGSFVTASNSANADLFWALRGGGGNFGIVVSFLFRAQPAAMVYGGPIFFDLKDALPVARWYREFQAKAPEAFYVFLGMQTVPSGEPFPKEIWGRKIAVLVICHNGPMTEAEAAVNDLRAALPGSILDLAGPMPYPALQTLFDGLYPKGLQWYWKGDFVDALPDAAIQTHIEHSLKAPSEISAMHLYPIDGAVHRKASADTAWATRDATWSMIITGVDPDPSKAPALKAWAKEYWNAIHPYDRDGAYPNFMMDDEGEARLKATFGANYPRLVTIKRKYDPENLFRTNLNIRP